MKIKKLLNNIKAKTNINKEFNELKYAYCNNKFS